MDRSGHYSTRRDPMPQIETALPARRLYRIEEVVSSLALSRAALYSMMGSGKLKFVKLGKSRRIPVDEVERLIRENTFGK
jgi:excisionase family DNA binding protein